MFAVPPNTVAAPAERSSAHPVRIALEHVAARRSWAHLVRYDPERRWSGLLDRGHEHEAWLLTWLPGQHTQLHDHAGATGAFTVVSGTLTETVLRSGSGDAVDIRHSLAAGQSRAFGPQYVHQVLNDGPDPAISIHVYRPARTRMRLYTAEAGALTAVSA